MLSDDWREEIQKAVADAAARCTDAPNPAAEINREIVTNFDVLTTELKRHHAEQERNERAKRKRENLTIGALFAAAAFTLFLAVGTYCLAITASQQIKLMEDDQRAWVGVASTHDVLEVGKIISSTVNWKNTGKSPALKIAAFIHIRSIGRGETAPPMPTAREDIGSPGILLPGSISPSSSQDTNPQVMNQPTLDAIIQGDIVLSLVGRTDYRDVEGNPHHTAFRALYFPSTNGWRTIESEAD
jgi:hypothetical protein